MGEILSDIWIKMLHFYEGSLHDINHFIKVHSFARLIGEKEGLCGEAMDILECAAILHDIACPLCRKKYGSARGDLQEAEGMPMTEDFLAEFTLPESFVEQVVWLVGHHHQIDCVQSIEHRILLEADYLVNAHESGHSEEMIRQAEEDFFRTKTGKELLYSMYIKKSDG